MKKNVFDDLKDYFECKAYLEGLGYEKFDGFKFYNYIFPNRENSGEINFDYSKPNPVYLFRDFDNKKIKRRIMLNDTFSDEYVKFVEKNNLALCGGLSYRGNTNRLEHSQHMNALIFDLDEVGFLELEHFFKYFEKFNFAPRPTFLVLSGKGLHVYYVFENPIELFPNIKLQLKSLKYNLTPKIWYYGGTSKNKNIQYQSINQSFRMVGSINEKHGNEIIAFKVGEKVDLEYLNSFAEEKNRVDIKKRFKPSKYTLEEAKIKFPQWYEKTILNGEKYKSKWHIKRDLYEWWKTKIDLIEGGHRYFYLMCLAIYAYKCDVSKKELKIDMWKIFTELKTKKHFNEFTKFDVISALESYDKGLANFTIKDIEYLTNVRIDRNRRNGRKQNEHLKLARFAQKLNYPNDEWRQGNGRPSKEKEVQEWQKLHPNGTKADCHKDTKISRQTIHKFWQN